MNGCFLLILLFLPIFSVYPLEWVQTDWSGGGGEFYWGDSTKYYSSTLNGWRNPGILTLDTPSDKWEVMGDPDGAKNIWVLLEFVGNIYAGVDNYPTTGTGRVLFSNDNGHNWTAGGALGSSNFVHALLEYNDVIYAGTDGNVYKSSDAGTTWTQTGSLSGVTRVDALALRNDTIFAGTGTGGDVFKSGNCMNWTNTGELTDATIIWDLLVGFDGTMYAAGTKNNTSSCIFRSTDGGGTWVDLGFSHDVVCYALAQAADSTIYAGIGVDSGYVYKSTDGGDTWIVTSDLGSGLSKANIVYSIIIADDGSIYAGTLAGTGAGRVFKSKDGGNSWSGISLGNAHIYSLLQSDEGFIYAGQDRIMTNPISRTAYDSTGYLNSSVYDTEIDTVKYGIIHWDADLHGCNITVGVQADTSNWFWPEPETIEVMNNTQLPEALNDKRYVRYIFEVYSSSADSSPVIDEISIGYSPGGSGIGVDEFSDIYLYTPVPNPFTHSTTIRYINPRSEPLSIDVYDICGRLIRNLINGFDREGCIKWKGQDKLGRRLPPGVYFVRLDIEERSIGKKVIFLGQ